MNNHDHIDDVPELEEIAEIDWDRASWQFNLSRILRHTETGDLYRADDAGCSCPIPFELTTVGDLDVISRVQDWDDYIFEMNGGADAYYDAEARGDLGYNLDPVVIEEAAKIRRLISDHFRNRKERNA